MGGVFDPIHIGHLNCANSAADIFGLEKVYFIPTAVPPHKKKGTASADHRYRMAEIAVLDNPRFEVSRIEMDKKKSAYSIDTVMEFKKRLKRDLYFIIGLDAFEEIHTWKSADKLIDLCNFAVIPRPGSDAGNLGAILESELGRKISSRKGGPCGRFLSAKGSKTGIYICPATELDISSTILRKKIRKGESIKYLAPDGVEQYIIKKGIYL